MYRGGRRKKTGLRGRKLEEVGGRGRRGGWVCKGFRRGRKDAIGRGGSSRRLRLGREGGGERGRECLRKGGKVSLIDSVGRE
jgi:hypothetical protein